MSRQNIMDSKSIWGYTRAYTRTPLQHKPLNLLRCINPLPILKQKANKRTKTHKQKPFSDAASVSHKDFLVLQQGMERSGLNQIFFFSCVLLWRSFLFFLSNAVMRYGISVSDATSHARHAHTQTHTQMHTGQSFHQISCKKRTT